MKGAGMVRARATIGMIDEAALHVTGGASGRTAQGAADETINCVRNGVGMVTAFLSSRYRHVSFGS
jgi:hypothetical protein